MTTILKHALKRWWGTNPNIHGAAIAYYTIFSIAPLSIVLAVAVGRFFNSIAVEQKIEKALQTFTGQDVSFFVEALLSYERHPVQGLIAGVLSTVLIIIGALALFSQVQRSLEDIWHDGNGPYRVKSYWQVKLLAVVMIVILSLFFIVSIAAGGIFTILRHATSPWLLFIAQNLLYFNTYISLAYIFALLVCMYKYLPHKPVSWHAALTGAGTAIFLFIVGRIILNLYLTSYVITSVYGVAGAVMLILIWCYYIAQLFFFGGAVAYAVDQSPKIDQTYSNDVISE
jgi:membrane protein